VIWRQVESNNYSVRVWKEESLPECF